MRRTTPTYEGRPLARPDDEVVDQGLGFDLVTVLNRRRFLAVLGLGAATVGVAACGVGDTATATSSNVTTSTAAAAALAEIPEETAGPYPGDGSNGANVLTESGIVRSDITHSLGSASGVAEGVPMTLTLSVTDLTDNTPMTGAAVYVWHCNRSGDYSLYSDGITAENYLRGVQVVDDAGTVTFTSIYPACYSGRWPHIHFEVYPDQSSITSSDNIIATSQIAMPHDASEVVYTTTGYEASVGNLAQVSLDTDNVFSDGAELETPTVTGSPTTGYTVTMAVGVDTTTVAGGAGSAPNGGGPGGTPPAGGTGGGPPA